MPACSCERCPAALAEGVFLRDDGTAESVPALEDVAGSGVTVRAADVDEPFSLLEETEEEDVVRRPFEDEAAEEDDVRRPLEVVVRSAVGGVCEDVTAEVLREDCEV